MAILPKDLPALLEKLRIKARAEHSRRISIDKLDETHRSVLVRAINNVLSTELATFTCAQIIDGLPTADVGWDQRSTGLYGDHPLDEHETLCPGTMEKTREIYPHWNPAMLAFDPNQRTIGPYLSPSPLSLIAPHPQLTRAGCQRIPRRRSWHENVSDAPD